MAKTVFDVLKERIEGDKSSAKDFAQYKEVVGLIRGLEASKTHVADLSRNYMKDDDDGNF